ncbi:MAG: hypothetical protein HYR76_01105 [Ignavibacteria bacterium]|nr:hypothetical protein [Ignavibacteria bacterium]MBI3765965.1 hypothetical protein [Ignavibacteriales bacterium]
MQEYFLKLKSNLELTDTFSDSISTKHTAIREYLKNNLSGFKDAKLIGSLQRQTRIQPGKDGNFDIDILIIMGEFHSWVPFGGISPQNALAQLNAAVNTSSRYNQMDPTPDPPTVTLTYKDNVEVQLVPGYVDNIGSDTNGNYLGHIGRGFWVVKNGSWEMADYDHEAEYITTQNSLSGGYLIPTIKMLKAIKKLHFPTLSSYPLEIVASNIVSPFTASLLSQRRQVQYQNIIQRFFEVVSVQMPSTIQVPGSKSTPIAINPTTVATLVDMFSRIVTHINQINRLTSQLEKVEAWRTLFGDCFPTTLD